MVERINAQAFVYMCKKALEPVVPTAKETGINTKYLILVEGENGGKMFKEFTASEVAQADRQYILDRFEVFFR